MRTEWLRETRPTRFEEAYFGWTESRLTREEAARLPGVCPRTFRRCMDRYREEVPDGPIDERLSRVSHRTGRVSIDAPGFPPYLWVVKEWLKHYNRPVSVTEV